MILLLSWLYWQYIGFSLRWDCKGSFVICYVNFVATYIIELLREHLSLTALWLTLDVILIDKYVAGDWGHELETFGIDGKFVNNLKASFGSS